MSAKDEDGGDAIQIDEAAGAAPAAGRTSATGAGADAVARRRLARGAGLSMVRACEPFEALMTRRSGDAALALVQAEMHKVAAALREAAR